MLLALGLAVAAFAAWVVGIVGMGQFGEDICLDHPPAEATGYQTEGSLWPPRLTCIYGTNEGGTLEVDHWLYAAVGATWVLGFPLRGRGGDRHGRHRWGTRAACPGRRHTRSPRTT